MKRLPTATLLSALLASLAFTACVDSKVGRATVRDLVLIYDGGPHRPVNWNEEHFAD